MPVNIDRLRKKHKELKDRAEGGIFWLPKDGDNLIRILPPTKGKDTFYLEGGVHFNIGEDQGVLVCPKMTGGDDCPICDAVEKLYKSGSVEDVKIAKKIRAKNRYWMWVIDLNAKDKGAQLFGAGPQVFKSILDYFCDEDFGDVTDPEDGRNIIITKEGSGLATSYSVRPRGKSSSLKKDLGTDASKLLAKLTPLDKLKDLTPKSSDEIEELLGNTDLEVEEDEDRRKMKKDKKKKHDDEDEDLEEVEEDDEEEEEKPKKKKGKAPVEEEEEDDEEEKPKKKSKKSVENDEDESEGDDEDEDDEEKPKEKKGKKTADDDEEDESDESEEDEEEEKPKKKSRKSNRARK